MIDYLLEVFLFGVGVGMLLAYVIWGYLRTRGEK